MAVAEIGALVAAQIVDGTPLVAFRASYDITTLHTEFARLSLPEVNWGDAARHPASSPRRGHCSS